MYLNSLARIPGEKISLFLNRFTYPIRFPPRSPRSEKRMQLMHHACNLDHQMKSLISFFLYYSISHADGAVVLIVFSCIYHLPSRETGQ